MLKFVGASILVASAMPAFAGSDSDLIVARELGQIVSSADICGYALDAEKVSTYVSEKVAPMDSAARAMFQSGGGAQKMRLKSMSTVEKAATCALQAKLAEKYELTP